MLDDDQFAAEVGARLHAELADVRPAPGLAAVVRRRHVRRKVAGYSATVATVGVAAVLGIALATAPGTRPANGSMATASANAVQYETVAYVTKKADAALADLDSYLMTSTITMPTGRTEEVTDPSTGRQRTTMFSKEGARTSDISESGRPSTHPTVLVVDHHARAWWTYTLAPPPGVPNVDNENFTDPAEIRAALTAGTMQVVGHEQTDGADALHLRLVITRPKRTGTLDLTVDLWVDATSYLPRKVVGGTVTTTFSWLPRTEANLARLDLTPPAGYRHLPRAPERNSGPGVG
jgi:hypothetical protein